MNFAQYKKRLLEFTTFVFNEKSEKAQRAIMENDKLLRNFQKACAKEMTEYYKRLEWCAQQRKEIRDIIREFDDQCYRFLLKENPKFLERLGRKH